MEDYKPGDIPPSVSAHGLQAFAWMFFIRDNAKAAGFITKTPRPNHFTQYQIIDLQFFEDWQSYYDTIGYDEISKMHLLQNKRDFTRQRFATIDTISTKGIITDKAFGIFEGPVDSIRGKTVEIDFDFSIQSYKSLLIGGFAVSINDSTGQNLFWDSFFLNWIGEKWDGKPHNFRNRLLVEIPATASSLKIYFWNTKKTEFSIVDGRIQMSILREKTETGD
jgi:hypothetical protein